MDPVYLKGEFDVESYLREVEGKEERSELINGRVLMMAPASPRHSFAQAKLTQIIGSYLEKNRIIDPKAKDSDDIWRYVVEAWTYYGGKNCLSHDVAVFSSKDLPEIPEKGPIKARPMWVCEILSPSNWSTDTETKRLILQKAGVPFYWIVDPMRKSILVFILDSKGEYKVSRYLGEEEDKLVTLEPFAHLQLSIKDIFS